MAERGRPPTLTFLPVANGENWASLHCKRGHAVPIESGLRPSSPENGNFPNVRRRLSAISLGECPKSEPGDRGRIRKRPQLADLSASISGTFSEGRTAWLATQCRSHPSPRKFPANREFNREFCSFGALSADFVSRNRCAAVTSRAIPCEN